MNMRFEKGLNISVKEQYGKSVSEYATNATTVPIALMNRIINKDHVPLLVPIFYVNRE